MSKRYKQMSEKSSIDEIAHSLEKELLDRYGPMVSNEVLIMLLGYRTREAFRLAVARKTLPIAVFKIPNRRGKFALVRDIARWLAVQRQNAIDGPEQEVR